MKKHITVVITIISIVFIISSFTCISNALGMDTIVNPDDYIQSSEDNSGIVDIGNVIVWAVRIIGESIAVTMLIVLGIKYILSSAEEKAEYKQSLWPYILGAIFIFAGAEITNIIYKAFS